MCQGNRIQSTGNSEIVKYVDALASIVSEGILSVSFVYKSVDCLARRRISVACAVVSRLMDPIVAVCTSIVTLLLFRMRNSYTLERQKFALLSQQISCDICYWRLEYGERLRILSGAKSVQEADA